MVFYLLECKASDCWAYIHSVTVERRKKECCGAMERDFKNPLNYTLIGKKLGDSAFMTGYYAVSKRVKEIFEKNNISNCEFLPMHCTEWREKNGTLRDEKEAEYYYMKVKSTCGLVLDSNGNECPHCLVCNKLEYVGINSDGYSFDESKWDGSDIFVFNNKDNVPIITEKLKKILAKEKLTNIEFVKIHPYIK